MQKWARLQKLGDMAPYFSFGIEAGRQANDDYYRVYPFKRHLPAIIISAIILAAFTIPLFSTFGAMPEADGDLFSLVFIVFSLFWLVGWSVGVLFIAAVFLVMTFGRETLHVRDGCLILRIGMPGLGFGFVYPGALIRNFRQARPDEAAGSAWRGEHLAFEFAGDRVGFASSINGLEAEQELRHLRRLFPDHDQPLPANLPQEEAEMPEQDGATSVAQQSQVASTVSNTPIPASVSRDELSITSISSLALIAANLVPLLGVLLLAWDIGGLMLLFWAESAVIGFYNLLKMARIGKWSVLFFGPFFTGHFGGFMVVHLLFIYGFFINDPNAGTDIPVDQLVHDFVLLWPALLGFFISHGVSFLSNFIGRREYERLDIKAQMGQPYKRIVIMHLTIIFGGFLVMAFGSTLPALLLIIGLKLGTDLFSHLKEHSARPQAAVGQAAAT